MPIKDPERKRQHAREWARKKKAGLPTRTRIYLTPEERHAHNLACYKRIRAKRSALLDTAFGSGCFLCDNGKVRIIHRKDGKIHKKFCNIGLRQLTTTIKASASEYVRLCGICHKGVHWAMTHLGMTWDEILFKREESLQREFNPRILHHKSRRPIRKDADL